MERYLAHLSVHWNYIVIRMTFVHFLSVREEQLQLLSAHVRHFERFS